MKKSELRKIITEEIGKVVELQNKTQAQGNDEKVDVTALKQLFRKLSTSTISGLSSNEMELLIQLIPAMIEKASGGSTETALKDASRLFNTRTASIQPKS